MTPPASHPSRLAGEIRAASVDAVPLAIERYRHRTITHALRQVVFDPPGAARGPVSFAFSDGSVATPFPLPRLGPSVDHVPPDPRRFSVGLISGRHLELDAVVDCFLLRNWEIGGGDQLASEVEALAFERARDLIAQVRANATVVLDLYQTGLEAAVIGFYRAAVEHLERSRDALVIVSRIHRHADFGARELAELRVEPAQLQALCARFGGFFGHSVDPATGAVTELRWILERPMWEGEADLAAHEFPSLAPAIDGLRRRSLVAEEPLWRRA